MVPLFLTLSLFFSATHTPPTCQVVRPSAAVESGCDLAQHDAYEHPQILPPSAEVHPGIAGSLGKRVSNHRTPGLTEPREHVHAEVDCGHCWDMDDHHFATSIGGRKDYGPGHEQGAPTGWHQHRALPGNCGVQQHATPCGGGGLAANETIEGIIDALARTDAEALAVLVTNPRVQVVRSRTAIQVVGCDNHTIVAHIPMGGGVFSALAEFVAEQ